MFPTNAADRWWDGFEKRLRSRLRNCDCSRSAEQWRTYEPRRANDPEQPELCKETTARKLIQRVARTGQSWASSLSGEYSPRVRPLRYQSEDERPTTGQPLLPRRIVLSRQSDVSRFVGKKGLLAYSQHSRRNKHQERCSNWNENAACDSLPVGYKPDRRRNQNRSNPPSCRHKTNRGSNLRGKVCTGKA